MRREICLADDLRIATLHPGHGYFLIPITPLTDMIVRLNLSAMLYGVTHQKLMKFKRCKRSFYFAFAHDDGPSRASKLMRLHTRPGSSGVEQRTRNA